VSRLTSYCLILPRQFNISPASSRNRRWFQINSSTNRKIPPLFKLSISCRRSYYYVEVAATATTSIRTIANYRFVHKRCASGATLLMQLHQKHNNQLVTEENREGRMEKYNQHNIYRRSNNQRETGDVLIKYYFCTLMFIVKTNHYIVFKLREVFSLYQQIVMINLQLLIDTLS